MLEILNAGDFFGEIAALSQLARTANIITVRATTLLQMPAATLGRIAANPPLNKLFFSRLADRMARMHMIDLPGAGGIDQQAVAELRTVDASELQSTP